MDKFLIFKNVILLKYSGVSYGINNCYTGTISYADDTNLSCPSIRSLNMMLDICNKFTAEHYLILNSNKMYARRTRSCFRTGMRSCNSARMNKFDLLLRKSVVYT